MLFGARSKIGRGSGDIVKVLEDGITLYLEEARHRQLAMTSIRKYPAAKNAAESLRRALLNVQNDGGDTEIFYPRAEDLGTSGRTVVTTASRGRERDQARIRRTTHPFLDSLIS